MKTETENKRSSFASAFIAAQKEMGSATKDSKNPFFKNTYADLNAIREACLPVLNKHGIAVLQPIVQVEGKNFVKTLLLHESGESMEGLTEIIYSKQNDAQSQGSGITYARRYGLQSLVNVGAEDDDGNDASKPQPKKETPRNASGFSPDGPLANGDDMKETQRRMNEESAKKIRKALEGCETLAEIVDVKVKSEKELKRLQKYAVDLFNEIVEVAIDVKKQIEEGDLDDSAQLEEIGR